jgi:hypothetical protein
VLFKNFVLRVHLVQFICKSAANYFSKNLFEGLLIGILISLSARIFCIFCLLTHLSDLLVYSLNSDRLDVTNRYTINRLLILLLIVLNLCIPQSLLHLLMSKVASLTCFIESSFKTFVFAFVDMVICDVECSMSHMYFVLNSLYFMFLHFLSNSGSQVFRSVHHFIFQLLLLNFGWFIVNSKLEIQWLKALLTLFQSGLCRFS